MLRELNIYSHLLYLNDNPCYEYFLSLRIKTTIFNYNYCTTTSLFYNLLNVLCLYVNVNLQNVLYIRFICMRIIWPVISILQLFHKFNTHWRRPKSKHLRFKFPVYITLKGGPSISTIGEEGTEFLVKREFNLQLLKGNIDTRKREKEQERNKEKMLPLNVTNSHFCSVNAPFFKSVYQIYNNSCTDNRVL